MFKKIFDLDPIFLLIQLRDPGIYFTTTFSLYKMFSREKILYHPLMSKYAMRHLATGQLPRVLPHDIVISW